MPSFDYTAVIYPTGPDEYAFGLATPETFQALMTQQLDNPPALPSSGSIAGGKVIMVPIDAYGETAYSGLSENSSQPPSGSFTITYPEGAPDTYNYMLYRLSSDMTYEINGNTITFRKVTTDAGSSETPAPAPSAGQPMDSATIARLWSEFNALLAARD